MMSQFGFVHVSPYHPKQGIHLSSTSSVAFSSGLTACSSFDRNTMRRRCTLLCLLVLGSAATQAQPAPAPAPQDSITAAAAAPAPVPAPTQVEVRTLEPFNRVALCAPFTILVEPAAGYQLTIDAQSDVRSAITTLVDTQTLLVEASGFTSLYPVKVTVGLPANQLSAVTNRGAFPGLVAPGFTASKFTATAQGTGPLSVLGLSAQSLVVSNTG